MLTILRACRSTFEWMKAGNRARAAILQCSSMCRHLATVQSNKWIRWLSARQVPPLGSPNLELIDYRSRMIRSLSAEIYGGPECRALAGDHHYKSALDGHSQMECWMGNRIVLHYLTHLFSTHLSQTPKSSSSANFRASPGSFHFSRLLEKPPALLICA